MPAGAAGKGRTGVGKRKRRKGEIFIWLAILIVIVYAGITLIQLRGRISDAETDRTDKADTVASLTQENEDLEEDIEHADDPETIEDIAKDKLGLTYPGEQIYEDAGN